MRATIILSFAEMQGCYEHACDGKAADVVDEYIQMDRTCIEAMANKMLRIGKKYWQLEGQEVFQVCLVQSIACIRSEERRVGKECRN